MCAFVPVQIAERFDAMLVDESRSHALRRLIKMAVEHGKPEKPHDRPFADGRAVKRVGVSLTGAEAARLEVAALERSTNSANWLRTLMRRRLGIAADQKTDLLAPIADLWMETRSIGRNLNQAVKALNIIMADGRHDKEVGELRRVIEIAEQFENFGKRLREIALGDYRYWIRDGE